MSQTIASPVAPARRWSLSAITAPALNNPNLCKHCQGPRDQRSRRRLCRRCHANPAIRALYRPYKGAAADFDGPARPPRIPRTTAAGSADTRANLRRRVRAREELFWPGDPDVGQYDPMGVVRLLCKIFGLERLGNIFGLELCPAAAEGGGDE